MAQRLGCFRAALAATLLPWPLAAEPLAGRVHLAALTPGEDRLHTQSPSMLSAHGLGPSRAGDGTTSCQRWRRAADRLGETYAGHALRRWLAARPCAPDVTGARPRHWEWPWSDLAHTLALPPTLHRQSGDWSIRCGAGEARRRCALVHVAASHTETSLGGVAPTGARPLVATHFVIDRVGGREMLLWRIAIDAAPDATASQGAPSRTGEQRDAVIFRVGIARQKTGFVACGPTGCLAEVRSMAAGAVATRLAAGAPVRLEVLRGSAMATSIVPARGFGTGLAELIRLRRHEGRE
jgi:invasion protein IalB